MFCFGSIFSLFNNIKPNDIDKNDEVIVLPQEPEKPEEPEEPDVPEEPTEPETPVQTEFGGTIYTSYDDVLSLTKVYNSETAVKTQNLGSG